MTDFLLFEKALCEYNKISSTEKCGEKISSEKTSRKSSFSIGLADLKMVNSPKLL